MHTYEKEALCEAINSHDVLVEEINTLLKEKYDADESLGELLEALRMADNWLNVDSEYKGSPVQEFIVKALKRHL